MNNKEIITTYFEAFQTLKSKEMNALLAENVKFKDPAFGEINGDEVKYMWQFLTENAKNFSIDFEILNSKKNNIEVSWIANYTFSATGNQIVNKVNSVFIIEDKLIVSQNDTFNIKKWAKQAFGNVAGIAGPEFILKKIVQTQSKKLLKKYMSENILK